MRIREHREGWLYPARQGEGPQGQDLNKETQPLKGCPGDLQDHALGGDARTEFTGERVNDIHLTIGK